MLFRLYVRWKLRGLPNKAWRISIRLSDNRLLVDDRWQWVCELKDGRVYRSRSVYYSKWTAAARMREELRKALKRTKQKAYGNLKADGTVL